MLRSSGGTTPRTPRLHARSAIVSGVRKESSLQKPGASVTSVSDRPNGRWSPPPSVRAVSGAGRTRRRLVPYLLLLPSAVAIGLLLVWPAIQLALYSLQDYGLPQVTGAAPSTWVGLGNYRLVLSDPEFWSI